MHVSKKRPDDVTGRRDMTFNCGVTLYSTAIYYHKPRFYTIGTTVGTTLRPAFLASIPHC